MVVNNIDQESSEVNRKMNEAIYMKRLNPLLNGFMWQPREKVAAN